MPIPLALWAECRGLQKISGVRLLEWLYWSTSPSFRILLRVACCKALKGARLPNVLFAFLMASGSKFRIVL